MRFVIQRVTEATCEVDQKITGQITNGFCVLIGIAETDTKNIADKILHYMRTAGRETVHLLSKPEIRNLQTISTNILLQNAKKKFRMYKPESLVQI